MNDYKTLTKFDEKVYEISNDFSKEEIKITINNFFNELLARKRKDPYEGGLQAGGVILDDKSAFKINEEDGSAPHSHTFETLAQYLNGEKKFSGVDTMGLLYARRNDPNSWITLESKCFVVRILCGENDLIICLNTKSDNISSFQLKVSSALIECAKEIFQKGLLKDIKIMYSTRDDCYVIEEDNQSVMDFEKLESFINDELMGKTK